MKSLQVSPVQEILKGLNFKFKLFLFFSNHTVGHLDCNSFSYMQVIPSKFNFVKLKSRKIFPEELNPFKNFSKIQMVELFQDF
jgi:hypothetical protein